MTGDAPAFDSVPGGSGGWPRVSHSANGFVVVPPGADLAGAGGGIGAGILGGGVDPQPHTRVFVRSEFGGVVAAADLIHER